MAADDRETTIAFTDADEEMQVYTANRKLKNRLRKLGFEPEDEDKLGEFFVVPKEFLQFRKPRDFNLTDEEREERKERLRQAREDAGIGEYAAKKKKKKKKVVAKKKPKPAPEPEDEEDDDDFDDEEEETEVVRPKSRQRPKKKTSKKS